MGELLFKLRGAMNSARRDRRDRVAQYLEELSRLLEEVADRLMNGESPKGTCAQLHVYATSLPDVIRDELGEAELGGMASLDELALSLDAGEALWDPSVGERLPKNFEDELLRPIDREQEVAQLYEAAGTFRAVAVSLRAT